MRDNLVLDNFFQVVHLLYTVDVLIDLSWILFRVSLFRLLSNLEEDQVSVLAGHDKSQRKLTLPIISHEVFDIVSVTGSLLHVSPLKGRCPALSIGYHSAHTIENTFDALRMLTRESATRPLMHLASFLHGHKLPNDTTQGRPAGTRGLTYVIA
jgi:hypothetical protein